MTARRHLSRNACQAAARRVMDALHDGLSFIDEAERESADGWTFSFGLPTGDPLNPWEYLIGCSNAIFVDRHSGKARVVEPDEIRLDWMSGSAQDFEG